jgi:hypothetical protein
MFYLRTFTQLQYSLFATNSKDDSFVCDEDHILMLRKLLEQHDNLLKQIRTHNPAYMLGDAVPLLDGFDSSKITGPSYARTIRNIVQSMREDLQELSG